MRLRNEAWRVAALAVALVAAGCADDGSGAGAGDTAQDGGAGDAADTGGGDATGDAGLGDAGPDDAGSGDTSLDDTGGSDTGGSDTGGDDAGDALGDTTEDATVDDADTGTPDDAGADAGGEDSGDGDGTTWPPEGTLDHELWGGRAWGPVMGASIIGRHLWYGTMGVYELPTEPDQVTAMRGGIGRLDLDTGELRVFEEELPQFTYVVDPGGTLDEVGPMPTAGSVADGERVLTVAYTGVIAIDGETLTFHELLPADGQPMEVRALAVDRAGGRSNLWVGTNHGLYLLDPDTFAEQRLLGEAELGSADVGRLAVDPATGAVYAAVFAPGASTVARVEGEQITALVPGAGIPAGVPRDVVWSEQHGRAFIALATHAAASGGVVSWDGTSAETLAVEGQLAQAATGEAQAFGATLLALSEADDTLVVGGQMQSVFGSGIKGGGLAWIRLSDGAIAGLGGGKDDLPGRHVAALTHDAATGRTYAALREPCNEAQLRNVGLVAISFRKDGSPRYERPILSGIRSLTLRDGEVWAALRDDNPGFGCDGYEIRTGLVKLRANRSGELVPLRTVKGDDIIPYPGATDLDWSDAGDLAVATWKAGIFWGLPAAGAAINQAITFGTSLESSDVEWLDATRLWVTGDATHSQGDPPALADKGPRGAALVTLGEDGLPAAVAHYVRASEDEKDLTGLPSANVMDVLVLADGTTLLACAAERYDVSWLDRIEGGIFVLAGVFREGGVAHILADGTIDVVADSKIAPDPRALALAPDGAVLALDAQHGAIRIEEGMAEKVDLPFPLPGDLRAHDLRLSGDDVVASLWAGAAVQLGGEWQMFGGVGHAWQALWRADGVALIGTDEGLLRVRADGATDVAEPPIEPASPPPFEVVAPPKG